MVTRNVATIHKANIGAEFARADANPIANGLSTFTFAVLYQMSDLLISLFTSRCLPQVCRGSTRARAGSSATKVQLLSLGLLVKHKGGEPDYLGRLREPFRHSEPLIHNNA